MDQFPKPATKPHNKNFEQQPNQVLVKGKDEVGGREPLATGTRSRSEEDWCKLQNELQESKVEIQKLRKRLQTAHEQCNAAQGNLTSLSHNLATYADDKE